MLRSNGSRQGLPQRAISLTGSSSRDSSTSKITFRRPPSELVDCHRVLTETFGKTAFKGKQQEIVEAALLGADVLVVAPTGMGKSLCFQIPACADKHGITIVVSPLLALMKNQVSRLQELGIPATSLTSETAMHEKAEILKDLTSKNPINRLVYITPEKLMSQEFGAILNLVHSNRRLSRLVVDEAHCISEWGHDFRGEYRKLGNFRDRYKDVPIMALTASATPEVQDDIFRSLKMSDQYLYKVVHPFNRENLFYEVRYQTFIPDSRESYSTIEQYISSLRSRRGAPSCGIVYARTRATCDGLAGFLRENGIQARPYHRGISSARLDATLRQWSEGDNCDIVVATVCFGMGIDKADVRFVIHFDLPRSFEGYYQETGRAGRDSNPSKCIIYYSREDVVRIRNLIQKSHTAREKQSHGGEPLPSQRAPNSLEALVQFCENADTCRHVLICRYFGEVVDTSHPDNAASFCNQMCDVCKSPEKTKRRKAVLSSDVFVSSQRPRLEQEAADSLRDVDDEVYAYPGFSTGSVTSVPHGQSTKRLPVAISSRSRSHPTTRQPKKGHASSDSSHSASMGWWQTDGPGEGTGGLMVKGTGRWRSTEAFDNMGDDGAEMGLVRRGPTATDFSSPKRAFNQTNIQDGLNSAPKRACLPTDVQTPTRLNTFPSSRLKTRQKPFKVPFKKDNQQTGNTPRAFAAPPLANGRYSPSEDDEPAEFLPEDRESSLLATGSGSLVTDTLGSSPIKFDVEHEEVDAGFSAKIPLKLREETLHSIRKSLHRMSMVGLRGESVWEMLGAVNTSAEERSAMILDCSTHLEFLVMCYSATPEGYSARSSRRLQAIKAISSGSEDERLRTLVCGGPKADPLKSTIYKEPTDPDEITEIFSTFRRLIARRGSCMEGCMLGNRPAEGQEVAGGEPATGGC